jgi:hypothetical protein
MLSAIAVVGPGIDAIATDVPTPREGAALSLAAACGAAGPHWSPLDTIMAAGFERYNTGWRPSEVDAGHEGLFETHCSPVAGVDRLTLQVPVVAARTLRVVLFFIEVNATAAGQRVFSVLVNKVMQVCLPHLYCSSACGCRG